MNLSIAIFTIALLLSSGNAKGGHGIDPYIYEQKIEDALIEALTPFDNKHIPYLPTITVQPENDDRIDLTLTLSDIWITGISDLTVNKFSTNPLTGRANFEMTFNKFKFEAGEYSSGGHFLTIPFNGESYFRTSFEGVNVKFSTKYDYKIFSGNICFDYGEAKFNFDVRKPEVLFHDLNPGTDVGQSLNIIISAATYDVFDYADTLMSQGTVVYKAVDKFMVDALNKKLCPE